MVLELELVEPVRKQREKEGKPERVLREVQALQFFSSGCTPLDLVLGGGYPLGRISNVVGDKSTGKCIKNSYLLSDKGFLYIDDVGENKPFDLSEYKENLGLYPNQTVTTSHFYKQSVDKTIKIKTRHGYELEGTPNHPILVWNSDCSISFKQLGELKKDDYAVIIKGLNLYSKNYVDFPQIKKNFSYEKTFNLPSKVTPQIGKILGYIIADGGFHGNAISISNSNEWYRKDISEALDTLGVSLNKDGFGISGVVLKKALKQLCGNPEVFTARFKYVPNCILQSPKDVQIAFLKALIDCDSYGADSSISYTTASEKLANQVHLMLLNLGILSTHSTQPFAKVGDKIYNHTYHSIAFFGEDFANYMQIVGSNKYQHLSIKDKYYRCSNYDSIPFILEKIRNDIQEIREIVGWSKNGKMDKKDGRFPRFKHSSQIMATHPFIEKFISTFKDFKEMDLSIYNEIEDKKNQYHFDKIVQVEEKNDTTTVYDVHVPHTHAFWSNGFISHNTLLAIEACANFALSFPDGDIYYHEAEAAFDEDYARILGMPIEAVNFVRDIRTVEETYLKLMEVVEKNNKALYIIDSLDALSDKAELEREIDEGSYGGNKPKKMGELFRRLAKLIESSQVHLMIISQERDKIGVTFGKKSTRSGGRSLDYYASQIIWLSELGKRKRVIDKVERKIGIDVRIKCEKNKIAMPFRECDVLIVFGYGIDDVTSCLEWLKDVGRLEDSGFTKIGIENIETEPTLAQKVRELTISTWNEIEEKFKPKTGKYN